MRVPAKKSARSKPRPIVGKVRGGLCWPVEGPPALVLIVGDGWRGLVDVWKYRFSVPRPSDAVRADAVSLLRIAERSVVASVRRATSSELREFAWLAWHNELVSRSGSRFECHPSTPVFARAARAGARLGVFLGDGDPCQSYVVDDDGQIWKFTPELATDRAKVVLSRLELVGWLVRSAVYVYPSAGELSRAMVRGDVDAFPVSWARQYCFPVDSAERGRSHL